MQLAYFHGFASGPQSTKAQYFRARLAEVGATVELPDLAPDFTHLTITGMLRIVDGILARGPAVLMGSSLGGYLAALAAARTSAPVRGLVLFAPAFGFVDRWKERIGARAVAAWRKRGTMPVYHYGREREEPLSINLLDDAARYPDEPASRCPTLVFAGRHDEAVPLPAIEHWSHSAVDRELIVMDSGHELTDVLEPMWIRTRDFLTKLGAL
jgi:alpha-beta hydrolase superfamily lysophospholipase